MYNKKRKKYICVSIYVFLFLVILFFATMLYLRGNMRHIRTINFGNIIDSGNLGSLTLTIYYLDEPILTPTMSTVEQFKNRAFTSRVVIQGNELEEQARLLRLLDSTIFIPTVRNRNSLDARLHYVFEYNGETFIVTGWGHNNSMFVNGHEVREHPLLYEMIIPFISPWAAWSLEVRMR